jgi:DNA polymerase-1
MTVQDPVYLIDGSAYIYRAYHAIAPLTNRNGLPTHAALGFTNILLRVIREKSPRFLCVAFDVRGKGFRHDIYSDYKANRPAMPDDLACQIPYIKEIVKAYNILSLERQGFEADDLIASAVKVLAASGTPVVIVSGDKDLLQLVSDSVTLWDPMNDKLMDRDGVEKKYHISLENLTDYFALTGDSSDNIPGVPGIGPKTAEKLISSFGSIENLYTKLDLIDKPALREKLAANRDLAFLSKKLITLKHDIDVPDSAEEYLLPSPDSDRLRDLFTELEFNRLIKSELPAVQLDRHGFRAVTTEENLAILITELSAAPFITIDTETTSLDPLTAELVGLSVCTAENSATYIPVGHKDGNGNFVPGQLPLNSVLAAFKPLLENEKIPKLCHNLKFDYNILYHHDIIMKGDLWDTMIASYLIAPGRRSHKLDDLGEEFLQKRLTSFAEVTGKDLRSDSFAYVPLDAARDYSSEDALATFLLWKIFRPELERLDLWTLFSDVEMALTPILAEIERTGILVETRILNELSVEFEKELHSLEQKIYAIADCEFNINSTRQLGEILFERLRLPHGRKTKTGYSTDVKVLETLSRYHELPAAVMTHRNLSKLKSTYVDKLVPLITRRQGASILRSTRR